jgi:hypothetical protein
VSRTTMTPSPIRALVGKGGSNKRLILEKAVQIADVQRKKAGNNMFLCGTRSSS